MFCIKKILLRSEQYFKKITLLNYINKKLIALNKYPVIMISITTIVINIPSNLGFKTLLNIIIDGSDNAVTLIINARIVQIGTPVKNRASAIVPNISAYIGTPIKVAIKTANGLLLPSILSIISRGIQLCIKAPISTYL